MDLFDIIDRIESSSEKEIRLFGIEACSLVNTQLNLVSNEAFRTLRQYVRGSAAIQDLAYANDLVGAYVDKAPLSSGNSTSCLAFNATTPDVDVNSVEDMCQNLLSSGITYEDVTSLVLSHFTIAKP